MEIKKESTLVQKKDTLEEKESTLVEVLKLFSPGTSLRIALDDIMRARMGALIAVASENVLSAVEGGFKINCRFSPQRLVELAKMDGAKIGRAHV